MASGECVVKINEVIVEAVNTNTGTPNPGSTDVNQVGNRNSDFEVEFPNGAPDFSGLQQAKQGASMLGRGIKQGAGAIGKDLKAGWQGAEKIAGATADTIGDIAQGAQQYIPGTQDRAAKLANQQNAKPWIDRWNQGIRANPEINTPEQLQQFGTKLATNQAGKQLFQVPPPKDLSKAGVAEYLTSIIGRVAAGVETGGVDTGNKPAQKNAQPATKSTVLGPDGKPMTLGPDGRPVAPAQSTSPVPDAHDAKDADHDQVPGAEIVQQEPIIMKYKNREYGLNDKGQWVQFGSTKVPHESFQAFLDKHAGFV